MTSKSHGVAVAEVRDLHGRSYRVGERPQDIMGRSRAWMLWLPAAAMAAISVLQYGYSVAATALQPTGAAAFWVLALWVMCQAGAAALTAALRHHSAVAPSRAMLAGALLCATGPLTLAYTDSFALAVLGYSVLCGSGAGACVAANKFRGIRAATCHDCFSAHQAVEDDDVNVLCLGSRVIGPELAVELLRAYMNARFSGAERHRRRLSKVAKFEEQFGRPT